MHYKVHDGARFVPDGYAHRDIPYEPPTGLKSFPELYLHLRSGGDNGMLPVAHLVNIISVIGDNEASLRRHDTVFLIPLPLS